MLATRPTARPVDACLREYTNDAERVVEGGLMGKVTTGHGSTFHSGSV
jgi:hypothetical protein